MRAFEVELLIHEGVELLRNSWHACTLGWKNESKIGKWRSVQICYYISQQKDLT